MTNERPHDEMVSATYRELASEQAPADLDEKVLRMAAQQAQHASYSRSVMWTRPLAWAATIALCLAITLEVTRGPTPEESIDMPARSDTNVRDQAPVADAPDAKTEADRPEVESSAFESVPQTLEQEQRSRSPASQNVSLGDDKENVGRSLKKQLVDEAVASPALEPKVNDADMIRRAEDMALMQSGTLNEAAAKEAAIRTTAASAPSETCSDEARAKPDSWLECIEELEMTGATDAAARERESFVEVFPDFQLP